MNECVLIARAASIHGVPASALAALRIAENGGPGREFGVLSIPAPTYAEQVDIAARSLKNSEARYEVWYQGEHGEPGSPRGLDGRYTEDFLRFFSRRWAPVGAENDPTDLNSNHAKNLIDSYELFA